MIDARAGHAVGSAGTKRDIRKKEDYSRIVMPTLGPGYIRDNSKPFFFFGKKDKVPGTEKPVKAASIDAQETPKAGKTREGGPLSRLLNFDKNNTAGR